MTASRIIWAAALAAVLLLSAPACTPAGRGTAKAQPAGLRAFASEAELRDFLRRRAKRARRADEGAVLSAPMSTASADAAAAPPPAQAAGEPGVTNVQEAGVDEGDIVKARGDLLVILRRGRVFTISIAGGGMRPVDHIDAFPPGVDARADWYDEMLVSGGRVVVIGYSYGRGGVEINRFRLSPDGRLAFEDAYHLRANDYYSSRNYASRLIGSRLIFYSPLSLSARGRDPLEALPGMRRWRPGAQDQPFRRIVGARRVFIPQALLDDPEADLDALHTVTTCDLAAPVLACDAVSVIGPYSRNFYVSPSAVYVWVSGGGWRDRRPQKAYVYRLPLTRGGPTALAARGAPTDQFSFREAGGFLNVLLRPRGGGEGMWRPEFSSGGVALLRAPIASFGDGSREAPASQYRFLPRVTDGPFQNRFVGEHVLYAAGGGWGPSRDAPSTLVAAPVAGGAVTKLELPHAVDRIEVLGRDGLVVGGASDLHFTTVMLSPRPQLGYDFVLPAATQGESRSHAFFFRPDTVDGASGLLGLPVARPARAAYRQLFESSASLLFLKRDARRLSMLGELPANDAGAVDDACRASCVDWYGNARPIFLRGRVFALLGYELVEGAVTQSGLSETGRISFAPRAERPER